MLFKSFIARMLRCLDPELAHNTTILGLKLLDKLHLLRHRVMEDRLDILGLSFPNRVGLAAGFDKNGEAIDALLKLGFGFVEIGTVTPMPQSGNPFPRVFRLSSDEAVINRYGFNSKGVAAVVENLKKRKVSGIVGVNIGKNKSTPLEDAYADYAFCLNRVAPYADYITVNISSPNTPALRALQSEQYLGDLLHNLVKTRDVLAVSLNKRLPLLVKISPDCCPDDIQSMARTFIQTQIDGVIATNTTIDKTAVSRHPHAEEAGGLSGKPLFEKSTAVLQQFHQALKGKVPLIGVGGIHNKQTAQAKYDAGADLIQVYTSLIYGAELTDFI